MVSSTLRVLLWPRKRAWFFTSTSLSPSGGRIRTAGRPWSWWGGTCGELLQVRRSSFPRRQDYDRIRIKDFVAVATRLRNAEAAVVDVLVEHCGDLDVIAGVGKRAFQQISHGVAELVLRFLRRWQLKFRKQVFQFGQQFIENHRVLSVAMTDGIIGCPHQQGIDYEGEWCPVCVFWHGRDRFTGQRVH